jgi:hypothetical protein
MMGVQVGGGGDQVSFMPDSPSASTANSSGANTPNPIAPVSFNSPQQQPAPYFGGTLPSPAAQQYGSIYQPGYPTGGTGGGGGMAPTPAAPPPVHHTSQEFLDNGQAYGDPTYVTQKAALMSKLNDYENNVASQVGSQNLSSVTDPNHSLLGSYYKGNALGSLYHDDKTINGDDNYQFNDKALGGTLGKDFSTALANFNNQQSQGLRNNTEDFAARGMLGSGSGVWQTSNKNLGDQYGQQLSNLNDSTVGQYNNLLSGLASQYNSGQGTLNGYLGDASQRMANTANAGLPTSV